MPISEPRLVSQLQAADRPAILAHLLGLCDTDRVQRFSQPACDETTAGYVARLDFNRDAHYGIWQDVPGTPVLIGLTHLAIDPAGQVAEIGVSVAADQRRRGLAGSMLARAILHARNVGVAEVVMYFLPYNTELIELAKRLGMKLSVGEGQGIARLRPASPDPISVVGELAASWAELTDRSLRDWSNGMLTASATLAGLASVERSQTPAGVGDGPVNHGVSR